MSGLPWFSQLKRELLDFADKNTYKDYFKPLISGGKMLLDKDIREPLFDFLEERYGKVRILEEKTVGNSRADVVMVIPDKIVGIEIKSDADTYTRLESQVADYDLYFDQNIVVVGSTHAGHVAEHVPDYWGIISVEEYDTGIKSDTGGKPDAEGLKEGVSDKLTHKIDFYVVREMQPNPRADLLRTIRILWRPELAHIQETYSLPMYKGKSKDFVRTLIVDRLPAEIVHHEISEILFERDYAAMIKQIQEFRKAQAAKRGKTVRKKKKRYRRKKRDA